jgi:hypothetical protein
MLNLMLHHLHSLVMAGFTMGMGPAPTSSSMDLPTCVQALTVSSTITNGAIVTTVTPNVGTACATGTCPFPANPGSTVSVTYTNSTQFSYQHASDGVLTAPPTSITTPMSNSKRIAFAVLGANVDSVLFLADPKITVTAGGCTTST